MAARKKTRKPLKTQSKQTKIVLNETRILFMQAMLLAVIGGVVLFGIIKMVQLRDSVDAMLVKELTKTTQQVLPTLSPMPKKGK